MTELEHKIREALAREAELAPSEQLLPRGQEVLGPAERGRAGARRSPWRSWAVAAVTAAAVAASVGVVSTLPDTGAPHAPERRLAADGSPGILDPVEVGRGRAVVDVPDGWGRGDAECGVATGDTVLFETLGGRACLAAPTSFDTVTIGSSAGHEPDDSFTTTTTSDGETVYRGRPSSASGGRTAIEVIVPAEDAWFLIEAKDPALTEAIADSVHLLPRGRTAVPDFLLGATGGRPGYADAPGPAEVRRRLGAFGLILDARFLGPARPDRWSSLTSDAEPGSVVPVGTEITVTYELHEKR